MGVRGAIHPTVKTMGFLADAFDKLSGQFTNESMTDLTYKVDVEGKSVEDVARDFLAEKDLISNNN